ncbi:MAG: SDR family NAD(P)-dependent oxidoreductase [Candidatus Syntrophonatronum acetioxidans]|uniref:SDR family NAD(P)-dependent oxidoreductase n=1 Tax=Candidatus Syntrophonatronum acetioxidans TaxID=1795816 RepID=A0A424YE84_9FIRM|nr:MAG: SDR family NAD(P)-dependent oxidoreductase [Candidatus Syntrophonatronum acetioxidans]
MISKKSPALVTGASSGIGRAIALRLSQAGIPTWATARRPEALAELAEAGCRTLALDVTEDKQAREVIAMVEAEHGEVGYLINNAGYQQPGHVEEIPLEAIQAQFDVNVFGLVRMTQLVLPGMRARKSGRIINISSVGAMFSCPMVGIYHATKYAVEAISDALRMEVKPFGIQVIQIQPPGVRTQFISTGNDLLPDNIANSPYAAAKAAFAAKTVEMEKTHVSPDVVASAVLEAVEAAKPRPLYRVGSQTHRTNLLRRLLPKSVYDGLLEKALEEFVPDPSGRPLEHRQKATV